MFNQLFKKKIHLVSIAKVDGSSFSTPSFTNKRILALRITIITVSI